MQKYIENPGPNVMFVGGTLIPPGEGRHVDVPAEPAPEAPQADDSGAQLNDQVAELRKLSAKDLSAALPGQSAEVLDLLAQAEKAAAKPRSTVLQAIESEQLARAAKRLDESGEQGKGQ